MTATVIVPTHNGYHRLRRLLESLDGCGAEVVVVDNASSDGSGDLAAAHGATTIRAEENLGFGRAVNLAARRASGSALVFVNDDCVCDSGFVAALAGALEPRNGAVMAAGVLLEPGRGTIDTAGMELDGSLLVFDYLNGRPASVLDGEPRDPIGPCAAAAAFDRDAFLEHGGFDERLFAYWEDVDLVLRLRRDGARCRLAPTARGVHEHSATLGPGSAAKDYLTGFGRAFVLRKWRGGSIRAVTAAALRDVPVVAAQLLVDGTLAGARGRVDGWRAGASAPRESADDVLAAWRVRSPAFRRRYARRARLRNRLGGAG